MRRAKNQANIPGRQSHRRNLAASKGRLQRSTKSAKAFSFGSKYHLKFFIRLAFESAVVSSSRAAAKNNSGMRRRRRSQKRRLQQNVASDASLDRPYRTYSSPPSPFVMVARSAVDLTPVWRRTAPLLAAAPLSIILDDECISTGSFRVSCRLISPPPITSNSLLRLRFNLLLL